MHNRTVRGATATLAVCAALAGGAAAANAAPVALEPYVDTTTSAPVAEEFTSTGSSTISSSVNAKVACFFQRTFSAMPLEC